MTRRKIEIEFLYLDLKVCGRCQGTSVNLDAGIDEVSRVLRDTGVDVTVTKTRVTSEEQARQLQFRTSPTIRVNGKDIALEFRESQCHACTTACERPVDCRVWAFQGREFTEAPKAMIVDAILREVYAGQASPPPPPFTGVPHNLRRFFATNAESGTTGCGARAVSEGD